MHEALEEHNVEGEIVLIPDGERAIGYVEALDASSDACPDLVIIDLNLPRRPGREVLQAMRQSTRCRDVPVVVLSSSDAQADRADAAAFGASRYIRKPLRLADFLALGAVFKSIIYASK